MIKRKIHPTWLVTVGCLAFTLGVAWSGMWAPRIWHSVAWLIMSLMMLAVMFMWPRRYMILIAIAGGLVVGLWRGAQEQMALTLYGAAVGKAVSMSGTLRDDVDTNKRGELVMRLSSLESRGKTLPGELWLVTPRAVSAQRGDRVLFEGKLQEGFGSFAVSVRNPHILGVERPEPVDPALRIRDGFAGQVREVISEPQASLGIGYVVGQRRALPEELDTALKVAGLTHIVVASGYNLTILVRFAKRLFEKISRYLAGLSAVLMITGFIAITGMSPSMVRAGLVSGLSVWAWYVGRKFHPVTLLAVALAVTVLWQPHYAWGDLGWQLSFAAFAGVMIVAPLVHAYFWGNIKPSMWRQIMVETLSAQVATMPIIVLAFGTMSVIAPISNLLILPFVPVAMLLTFLAGLAHWIAPGLALVGLPAQWLLSYMTYIAETSAKVSWAQAELRIEWWAVVAYYIFLAALCLCLQRRTKYSLRSANIVE